MSGSACSEGCSRSRASPARERPSRRRFLPGARSPALESTLRGADEYRVSIEPDLGDLILLLVALAVVSFFVWRQRIALARLRRSDRHYRDLVELLPVGIYLDHPTAAATNIYSNPALVNMFGYPAAMWQRPEFFKSILHPSDRDK